jgi:hypothetical protein
MDTGRGKLWAGVLSALVVMAWATACGGDSQPSDAEQVRDVVTNFQRQVDAKSRGRLIACSLLTPSEHQRRDELGAGPCERTLPAHLQSAHIESVDVLDHKATVVLNDGRKISLNKIPMPFSETVSNPAEVWRINLLIPGPHAVRGGQVAHHTHHPRTECYVQGFGQPHPEPCHPLWREITGLGADPARQLAPKGPYANCITISMTRHGDVRKPCARSLAARGR